jgi:hypothetical protein
MRPNVICLALCTGLLSLTACAGGSSDPAADPANTDGSGEALSAQATETALVGTWDIDQKGDTDFVVTWWDHLELKDDKTFSGNQGGNVCDDDGNCEAGTTATMTGTYSLGTSGTKKTITFKFSDKKVTSDKFTFSLSGKTLTMQLAADKAKGGDFDMKKK